MLKTASKVGHERGVRVDGDVEEERVHRQDDQHRCDGREPREIKERRRGQRHSGDEERLASSDARARPVGDCAHNWLRERARERTLLREESDRPDRDLGVAVQVKAGRAVQEVVDGVRPEVAEAVDHGLAEREWPSRPGWFHGRRSNALARRRRPAYVGEKVLQHTRNIGRTLVLTTVGADNRSPWMPPRCSRSWQPSRR